MAQEIFLYLSITLIVAVASSVILRLLRQPLIIAYIITGIILSTYLKFPNEILSTFSQIGIALLLFIVGLNLNPKVIKELGGVALITGLGQILFTAIAGFFICVALGFNYLESLYISVAITFSSTIIVSKLLSDKGDLDKLYGKISVGFLIVQDIAAIIILMIISSSVSRTVYYQGNFILGILLLAGIFLFSFLFLKRIIGFSAKSSELLFLVSISWCFVLATLFWYFGFSFEIGALLAGISLSTSLYNTEIMSKIKPLRDFFIMIFFVYLGLTMNIFNADINIPAVVILSLFILIGNPLIMMIIMGLLGYTKRTGFMTGMIVAQISEFSLIMIALGAKLGHIREEIVPLVTLIGVITIAGSTYLINYSERIYPYLERYLSVFERKTITKEKCKVCYVESKIDSILFGYNRIGYNVLKSLQEMGSYAVFDFNPSVIRQLVRKKIPCIYGDASNMEMLDELQLNDIKLAVSTIPEIETNLLLIKNIRRKNKNAIVIVIADQIKDALKLYNEGADYVITPHFLGGEYIKDMIANNGFEHKKYSEEKVKHIKQLKERVKEGHEHPASERRRMSR